MAFDLKVKAADSEYTKVTPELQRLVSSCNYGSMLYSGCLVTILCLSVEKCINDEVELFIKDDMDADKLAVAKFAIANKVNALPNVACVPANRKVTIPCKGKTLIGNITSTNMHASIALSAAWKPIAVHQKAMDALFCEDHDVLFLSNVRNI